MKYKELYELAIKQNSDLIVQIKSLNEKVDYLLEQLFGSKSEKSKSRRKAIEPKTTASDAQAISDILLDEPNNASKSAGNTKALKKSTPKRTSVTRRDYNELVDEEQEVELPDVELPVGARLLKVEKSFILYYQPGKVIKIRYKRNIYVKDDVFYQADLPLVPLARTYLDSSLLGAIITNKYAYHLPLERQLTMFSHIGVDFPKSTFNNWTTKSLDLLMPLADRLQRVILKSDYLNIDETTIPLFIKGEGKCSNAYLWGVTSQRNKLVWFHYNNGSRGQKVLEEMLGDYSGTVQSDACSSYNILERSKKTLMLSCLAHIRRKFNDCGGDDRLAIDLLNKINMIYHLDHENKKLETDDPLVGMRLRKNLFTPMKEVYRLLQVYKADRNILPKSNLGRAISYALNEAAGILNCLRSSDYSLDNNAIEREFKNIIIGRKNYLFVEGHASAVRTAAIYSIIGCCRLNNINPQEYLTDVLYRINDEKVSELDKILPHKWKPLKRDAD